MSKVKISSSITVPYSFTDDKGKVVSGESIYVMVSTGGAPRVEKATSPLNNGVEIDISDLVFDYKKRIITDKL